MADEMPNELCRPTYFTRERHGFRAPNHLKYRFYGSIGYLSRWLEDKDRAELEKTIAGWMLKIETDFEWKGWILYI